MDKYIGIVISVDSAIAEVAMYDMVNDANILWEGQVLPGPKVGSFISILQGNVRIIAKVISEKIIDQQNSIGSKEFDNRYSKDSINRVIKAKSIGTVKGGNFQVTSRYVPMVGNKVSWISQEDYAAMYALGENVPSLRIGEDLLGDQEVNIPIDRIFASHIGVFGNTGSGKSNTLHRLYLNLFRSEYGDGALEKSKFIVIDFNGEYSHEKSFGVSLENKSVYRLSTKSENCNRVPLGEGYLFDSEVLSVLFDARPATQVPFINSTLKYYNEMNGDWDRYAKFIIGTFFKLLITKGDARGDALSDWIELYQKFTQGYHRCSSGTQDLLNDYEDIADCNNQNVMENSKDYLEGKRHGRKKGDIEGYDDGFRDGKIVGPQSIYIKARTAIGWQQKNADYSSDYYAGFVYEYGRHYLHGKWHGSHQEYGQCPIKFLQNIKEPKYSDYELDANDGQDGRVFIKSGNPLDSSQKNFIYEHILYGLSKALENSEPLKRLEYVFRFSYIHNTAWGKVQKEHLDPLMKRLDVALKDLDKVILVDDSSGELKSFVVVDLLDANQRIKRMIPMLFAKMMYGEQKNRKGNESTSHLIIDEAHNILNANAGDIGDHWRDYRLDIFEEIIKEGRKFGFYVTLSSQRPADISPTIVSQVHNYFIHRLVNDLDLRMIERTMPTLDRASFDMIPTLGKGECVVTGTAFSLPVFTIVDWDESDPRPHSDDLILTDLWIEAEREAALKKAEFYSDSMYMSKQGIYNELTSKSEMFTHGAAQYAVDNIEADWNANALEMAKSDQQEGMSHEEIYLHLTSDEEGFTEEEAEYAVSHLD